MPKQDVNTYYIQVPTDRQTMQSIVKRSKKIGFYRKGKIVRGYHILSKKEQYPNLGCKYILHIGTNRQTDRKQPFTVK